MTRPAFLATIILCLLGCDAGAATSPREVVSLDQGWRFHLGDLDAPGTGDESVSKTSPLSPDYDDAAWTSIDVPHDYVVEGTFTDKDTGHGGLARDVGWYRRTIQIPATAKGRRLWLEFDGVCRNSRYWLNGKLIGMNESSYIGCRFDITDVARPGEVNTLAVRVDPRSTEGWWYDGGGIYRHVRMVSVDPVHVAPWGVFVTAAVPDAGDGVSASATLTVTTTLANQGPAAVDAVLLSEVLDAAGKVVAKAEERRTLAPGEGTGKQTIPLTQAQLWSCEHPALYTLRSTLSVGGRAVDEVSNTFGVRSIRFDAERGFLLNGKPVKIKGVCNHQDHAGVGVAVPDRLHAWRMEQLKKMGGNGLRCAHNANAPAVYDACDRLGILVMDEFRQFGDTYAGKAPASTKTDKLTDQINQVLQNRNHPSIVIWSLGNEEPVQNSPDGARIATALKKVVDTYDGTRPTTVGVNGGFAKGGSSGIVDVVGFNYHVGSYDGVRKSFPGKAMIATETASEVSTRGVYDREVFKKKSGGPFHGNVKCGWVSAYGENAPSWAQTAERAWTMVADRPWMAGCFVWTGFDYKGEPTPFDWPCISSHFGIFDSCGFPKDSFYYYKSWWGDEPVIHVLPHWNWPGKEGQEILVWVHSNASEVELFLNGASLGKKPMKRNSHLEWMVKYAPGTLTAKGTYNGKEIVAAVETTTAPAAVVLEPDRSRLAADGADLSVVAVKIVDGKGRLVPVANNLVRFTVTGAGAVLGVGNGDPSCHEPDKATQRTAFNGLCMVLIQAGRKPGAITLKAESDGLKPATVDLKAE